MAQTTIQVVWANGKPFLLFSFVSTVLIYLFASLMNLTYSTQPQVNLFQQQYSSRPEAGWTPKMMKFGMKESLMMRERLETVSGYGNVFQPQISHTPSHNC